MEGVGLALLYPALAWSVCAPGHHGYPRAPDLILGKALRGRLGHQITGTTARPFLHFLNPTRRPRRVSSRLVSWRVLRSCVLAPTRSRRSAPRLASSARVVWYLMVMRQQPMALHARRSLIPNASRRWTTAFRFPAGITTSFPLGSSAPRCPASHALRVAKASKMRHLRRQPPPKTTGR